MRRRTTHAFFCGVAGVAVLITAGYSLALYRASRMNQAIAHADERVRMTQKLTGAAASRQTKLADGVALMRARQYDAAFKVLSGLITPGLADQTSQAALYDLGNLYLAQALEHVDDGPTVYLPFVELAKQRYRDLLRVDPDSWDARYNLERALRLAPEDHSAFAETDRDDQERHKIKRAPDLAAPDLP